MKISQALRRKALAESQERRRARPRGDRMAGMMRMRHCS